MREPLDTPAPAPQAEDYSQDNATGTRRFRVPLLPPVENPPQQGVIERTPRAARPPKHTTKPTQQHTALLLPPVPADADTTSALLTRATSIVSRELRRLDNRSHDVGLDKNEVHTVMELVKTLSALGEEERRAAQRSKLEDLSEDELRAAAARLLHPTADDQKDPAV